MKSCCLPAAAGTQDRADTAGARGRTLGAAVGMSGAMTLVGIDAREFTMGNDGADANAGDGEGPSRRVALSAFSIAATCVTNRAFGDFVRATRYVTDAERAGWSFVFWLQVSPERRAAARRYADGLPWWLPIEHASWQRPEGAGSHVHARPQHPVVHISWNDAIAYCAWANVRLPTEAEWECAARGGLDARRFAWGDELLPDGEPRCNIWRGGFPDAPADGWSPAPVAVDAYTPNGFGLYNTCGNVWEWCADWFSPTYHDDTPALDPVQRRATGRRSMRGGSFLCHDSYCNRYRVSARSANTPDSSAGNVGFRVAS